MIFNRYRKAREQKREKKKQRRGDRQKGSYSNRMMRTTHK